jgi:hypothetical protein
LAEGDPPLILRCGLAYYSQLPLMRKAQRLDQYPKVSEDERCEHWASK